MASHKHYFIYDICKCCESVESVQIAVTIVALNDLDILSGDHIGSTFIDAGHVGN
jgi:hypothetical protein